MGVWLTAVGPDLGHFLEKRKGSASCEPYEQIWGGKTCWLRERGAATNLQTRGTFRGRSLSESDSPEKQTQQDRWTCRWMHWPGFIIGIGSCSHGDHKVPPSAGAHWRAVKAGSILREPGPLWASPGVPACGVWGECSLWLKNRDEGALLQPSCCLGPQRLQYCWLALAGVDLPNSMHPSAPPGQTQLPGAQPGIMLC